MHYEHRTMRFRRPHRHRAILVAAAGIALLTAGCALGPDWNAIGQQAAQIRAGCEAQRTAGTIRGAVAAERCADGPIHDLYASAGYPDLDVLDAYLARRESIAASQDRNVISPEEARAQYAQAIADENTALQQRAASRSVSTAANMPMFCNRLSRSTMICQ
jgi:hypothetical protein